MGEIDKKRLILDFNLETPQQILHQFFLFGLPNPIIRIF